jgi:hypothetical protein
MDGTIASREVNGTCGQIIREGKDDPAVASEWFYCAVNQDG